MNPLILDSEPNNDNREPSATEVKVTLGFAAAIVLLFFGLGLHSEEPVTKVRTTLPANGYGQYQDFVRANP